MRKKLGESTVTITTTTANINGTSGTISVGAGYKAAYIIGVSATFSPSIGSGNTKIYGLTQSYNASTGVLTWSGLAPNIGGTATIARIKVS